MIELDCIRMIANLEEDAGESKPRLQTAQHEPYNLTKLAIFPLNNFLDFSRATAAGIQERLIAHTYLFRHYPN